jgi:hypothetical protein
MFCGKYLRPGSPVGPLIAAAQQLEGQ